MDVCRMLCVSFRLFQQPFLEGLDFFACLGTWSQFTILRRRVENYGPITMVRAWQSQVFQHSVLCKYPLVRMLVSLALLIAIYILHLSFIEFFSEPDIHIHSDQVGARTLAVNPGTQGGTAALTVELCTSTCQVLGYVFSGSEYGGECCKYLKSIQTLCRKCRADIDFPDCGNSFSNGGVPAPNGEVGCNMACNGNASEICGGPNRLSLYNYNNAIATLATSTSIASSTGISSTISSASATSTSLGGWSALGCYNDTVGTRSLGTEIYSIPGASMTVELCLAACKSASFTFAGVEYGGECYCDSKIENYGALQTSGCNMACNGNAAEICGGSNRLNMYSLSGSDSGTTTSSVSVSGTGTVSTSSTATPVVTSLPTGWKYKGCWIDQAFGRILGTTAASNTALTIESCVAECVALGLSIAGLEYYTQCYCGNAMINQAALATAETDCNTACGGNSAEMCGGGNRMSIYSNETTLAVKPVPHTQLTGLPGSWNYSGCLMFVLSFLLSTEVLTINSTTVMMP